MRIRLLGPVDVVVGARPVALGGAKERLLLAALALNAGELVPASRLAEMLWGDSQPRTAAATLRSHVSRLRRALQPGGFELASLPGGLCLRAPVGGIDVGLVEALVQDSRAATSPRAVADILAEALSQWRGPSLGDLADLAFAQADAARLDEFRTTILEQRVDADLACGRHASLVSELEALCDAHPYREGLWAARVLALYRCGRQADALRAYGELRRRLADDLGIDPSPQLRALEQAVLLQSPSLEARRDTGPRLAPGHEDRLPVRLDQPLAGRRRELEQLQAAWDRAAGGEPAAVLLAGEPGIGKTRLALAAAELAERSGGVAVYGRADQETGRPFGPVAEAAERLLGVLPPEERDEMVRPWAAELTTLLPGLHAGSAHEVGERGAVFDAVVGVLAAASTRAPILVVLDDLQWAGPETTLLLSHVLRARAALRVLVVGTYRDTEVGPGHPVADLLGERGVVRLSLGGLRPPELAELLGREDVADVARHSGGNPFIALELSRDPEGSSEVRDVLRRRFWQLGPGAYDVLRVAAVLGEEFPARLLEDVVEGDVVLDALDVAVRNRLLVDRGGGRFAFAHALVRSTLLSELTSARRARLHREVVDALAAVPPDEQDLDALAHHTAEAVADGAPLASAVDAAIRCARQAVRQLAPERALHVLDRADELVRGRSRVDRALRAELQLVRAEVLGFTGERAALRELAMTAAEDARAVGSGVLLAQCARQHFGWGEVGQHDPATVALCEEALELLGDDEPRWRSEVLAVHSQVLGNNLGMGARATAVADEAVEMARRSGDPDALLHALVALDRAWQGQPHGCDRRLEANDELVRVASVAGDDAMRFAGIRQQAAVRLELGDVAGFEAERRAMDRLHERLGSWFSSFWVRCYSVTAAILAGRFEQAAADLDSLTAQLADETNAVTMWAGMQAMLARERGEPGALVPAMDDAAERFDGLAIFRVGAASFQAEAGDLADAAVRYEALVADRLAAIPRDSTFAACLGGLVETAVRLRDAGRAPMLRELLEPFGGQFVVTGAGSFCYASTDRLLGMLLALEGRLDEAVEAYARALRLEVVSGAEPFQVRTRRWFAECLLARGEEGDAEEAADLLATAVADAARLGMPLVAQEIEPLLAWASPPLQHRGDDAATSESHDS